MFITIEGGEGVGKSTYLQQLRLALENRQGFGEVITTREPGGTEIGRRLRQIFVDPPEHEALTIEAEFMIVSAARAQHVQELILPAVKQGKIVLCDRYADSSRAYQGVLGGVSKDFIERVIEKTTYGLEPTLTILLDCSVEISMARVGTRNVDQQHGDGASRYDDAQKSVHQKLRNAFLDIAALAPERFIVQNAERPTTDNVKECVDRLTQIRGMLGS